MAFRSVCRKHIILVIVAPMNAIDIMIVEVINNCLYISLLIRIRPYPPSFSKTAASTIDPATGASTCAFGSHICSENKGSFTKKAIISIIQIIVGFIFNGMYI